jgi:long-chain acyl-CoA synthetase
VLEAAAVGIPMEGKGERIKVFIVLKPGVTATKEEIIDFCRENLAVYKVPKLVEFRTELPKSTVGKYCAGNYWEMSFPRKQIN